MRTEPFYIFYFSVTTVTPASPSPKVPSLYCFILGSRLK